MPELFIDGTWREAKAGGTREICCPANRAHVTTVDEAAEDDTVEAIAAARRAFDSGGWSSTSVHERASILYAVADLLGTHRDEVARAESLDTGKRYAESQYDVDDVRAVFRYFAGVAAEGAGRVVDTGRTNVTSRIVHEPIGVCGLITPWNYPLLQASWKVAPALAAGNTFVLKPSELTPSTAILLMRYLTEAGVPDGVANLVLGAGPAAGAPLATHPDVDMVSFTGGVETGRKIMASAAATVKKVALELGGKNPNIVFADADYDVALDFAVTAVFLHSGQVCSAGARLLVQESIKERFVDELAERVDRIRLGGPFDDDAETGALISAVHRDKIENYVAQGLAEGATLRCGGARPEEPDLQDGYFYRPTVLDNCSSWMRVVQEESFGPVLTVESFTDEAEAVTLANDSMYGLAGAVWTNNAGRAERVATRLRAGTVWINDYHPYIPQAEWGGYKQSGTGRELGPAGLDEYREIKHIWHNTAPEAQRWFGGG